MVAVRIMQILASGGVPERSKGPDCKSGGSAFAGSNPAPSTSFIGTGDETKEATRIKTVTINERKTKNNGSNLAGVAQW